MAEIVDAARGEPAKGKRRKREKRHDPRLAQALRYYQARHSIEPPMPYRDLGKRFQTTEATAHRMVAIAERSFSPEELARLAGSEPITKNEVKRAAKSPHVMRVDLTDGGPSIPMIPISDRVPVREVRVREMGRLYRSRAMDIAESITPEVIEAAGLKDRAVAVGILTEKGLLCAGKPTQITTDASREKLAVLFAAAISVAAQRGIQLPQVVTVPALVDVTPQEAS